MSVILTEYSWTHVNGTLVSIYPSFPPLKLLRCHIYKTILTITFLFFNYYDKIYSLAQVRTFIWHNLILQQLNDIRCCCLWFEKDVERTSFIPTPHPHPGQASFQSWHTVKLSTARACLPGEGTTFHKQRQHVKGTAGLEEDSMGLWEHVRGASAQTIGTLFPEETNGWHGLESKIHTMGRKNPRPSGFIPVLSGTTQPALVGVGPISCTALPALHKARRSYPLQIIAF